jgi:hypothetical protein
MDKNNVVSVQTEGRTNQSVERQIPEQTTGMVRDHFECLDTVWETDPQTRARAYRKIKLLIAYQLALSSPSPVAFSIMERNIQADNAEASKASRILLPTKLQEKVELAARQSNSTLNDKIAEVLTDNIGRYLGQEKKESEEADVVDS